MGRAVLLSVRPKWIGKMITGEKTVEIRKNKPNVKGPFKCYIYQTMPKSGERDEFDGQVVGEFICDDIQWHGGSEFIIKEDRECALRGTCVTWEELKDYLQIVPGLSVFDRKNEFYGWHISEPKFYDLPKKLEEFWVVCQKPYCSTGCKRFPYCGATADWKYQVKRPPMSWMYVEELP